METRRQTVSDDAADLHRFGYAQQLLRDMGGFANFAVSFTVISILTGAIVLFGHGLNYGGPAVNGLGWPIVCFFDLLVAASMAEIASAIPTAGAMYHWSALLGGPGWGWFTAWFNFVGQMATTAGVAYAIAQFAVDLLGLHGQAALLALYGAILLSWAALNHYGIRWVARCNDASVWYHIGVTVLIMVAFLFFAPRRPLAFAFHAGFTTSKYPYARAFMVGLLQAQWTITGYDASAHITEETLDPRRNAPWGMFLAVLLSAVFGYGLLLAVTLGIQDLAASAAAANPFVDVAERAFGKSRGDAVVWLILPAMWFCGVSSLTANARMTFAFARDRGMPGWRTLCKVSRAHRTPAPAIWLSAALAFGVGLYSDAFTVIASLSTIGLYVSYILPVILVFRARMAGRWSDRGPWHLGRWGAWVNAGAILWAAFICVLFVAPPNQQTGTTFAALTLGLVAYYFGYARGRFEGPKRTGTEEELLRVEAELSAG